MLTQNQPTRIDFPVIEEPVFTRSGLSVPMKAIIRTDTNCVIGTVSSTYKKILHTEVFESVEKSFGLEAGTRQFSACKNGAIAFARYDLPRIPSFEVALGDIVKYQIEIFNSYDGSMPVGFRLIGLRLRCLNGQTIPHSISSLFIRHTSRADITVAKKSFESKIDLVLNAQEKWKRWTSTPLVETTASGFENNTLGPTLTKTVRDFYHQKYVPELGPTVFAYFNALTHYSTHALKLRKGNEENTSLKRFHFEKETIEKFYQLNWN